MEDKEKDEDIMILRIRRRLKVVVELVDIFLSFRFSHIESENICSHIRSLSYNMIYALFLHFYIQ